jgi:hypothetical protein
MKSTLTIAQVSDKDASDFALELSHSKKDHDKFLKDYKPTISSLIYNDFNPDSDEYEPTEVSVVKSELKLIFKEANGKMTVALVSAEVEISFDDADQQERFEDKDWESEWIEPTICFKGSKDGDEIFLPYENNSLFTG